MNRILGLIDRMYNEAKALSWLGLVLGMILICQCQEIPPGSFSASPGSLTFGNVRLGNCDSAPVTITHLEPRGFTIYTTRPRFTTSSFSVTYLDAPDTADIYSYGASKTLTVHFCPQENGLIRDTLRIGDRDTTGDRIRIPLQGVGVP